MNSDLKMKQVNLSNITAIGSLGLGFGYLGAVTTYTDTPTISGSTIAWYLGIGQENRLLQIVAYPAGAVFVRSVIDGTSATWNRVTG